MNTEKQIAKLYKEIGEICDEEGEVFPANVCYCAANELSRFTSHGDKIIQRRAMQNQYIGDLYYEH